MDHKQGNQSREQSAQGPVLYVAFELASSTGSGRPGGFDSYAVRQR